jgi:hypothetical protein
MRERGRLYDLLLMCERGRQDIVYYLSEREVETAWCIIILRDGETTWYSETFLNWTLNKLESCIYKSWSQGGSV